MTFPPLPKLPQVNKPPGLAELSNRQQQYEEFQAAIEKSAAITSAQNITPTAPTTINQETLTPDTSGFEPPPPDRNGFLNRIQSLAEASAGGLTQLGLGLIPGEQSMFNEKELGQNITDAGNELERPTNPWDMLRWDAMRHAEGWRRTDQASISLDLIPFGGEDGLNLPGGRTLNEIDFGVKGAAELILDPLNLVPFGAAVKFGGKGTAIALRAMNAGSLVEASIRGRNVMAHAAEVARGFAHPLGNVPQPKDLLPNSEASKIEKLGKGGIDLEEIPNTTSAPPPEIGVRGPDGQFIRPETTDKIIAGLGEALEKMPNWVAAVRDMQGGRYSKFYVGPMQWGMTRMNPITMLHAGTDISKRLRLATIAHQIQAVGAQTQTDFALRTLDNYGGYTGEVLHGLFSVKNEGVLSKLGVNRPIQGVFDVDDNGFITNLVNVNGSQMRIADNSKALGLHQYAVFEAAFKEGKGYAQSGKWGDKVITELGEEQITKMIADGTVSAVFVNQSFAIKHIQNWFDEAGKMLDEFGVPRTELYDGDDLMSYISRVARGKDDILFPKNKKTTGSVQSIAKKRKYVHQSFVEGLEDGLQYENNFMLSAREFSDSVYMSIRDTQLKNKANALGHRVRDDELNPIRALLNQAKERVGQLDRALALVNQNSRGAKLTGAQVGALKRVGEDLGYDWSETKAIDVTSRQIAALKELRLKTKQQLAEAKVLEKFVRGEAAKDLSELFTKMGIPHSRSGNIWNATEIPQAFQKLYPEFTKELRKLQAMDVKLRNAVDLPKKRTRQTDKSPLTGKPTTTTVVTNKKTASFEKKRTTLANAIKLDAKRYVADAKAADKNVRIAQGRTLTGSENSWLKNNFPELKKELDDATSADVGAVRKERIAKVREAIEEELVQAKKMNQLHADDLSKKASGLRGDIWTVNTLSRGDHLTGKHPIKVVSGGAYRDALEDGTFLIKRREASQQRLPFMSGLFFTEPDIKALERALLLPDTSTAKGQTAGVFLRVAPAAGDLVRVLKAGFDFGAPFLQGIPILATRPDIWFKGTLRHLKVFGMGGQVHTQYLQQNMGALREMVQMGVPFGGAASDYFTAVQRGGILPKVGEVIDSVTGMKGSSNLASRAIHKTGRSFESLATRFEQSFESYGDYARIEMWKAMRDTAAKDGETGLKELAGFIRNSTGALNSGSLGVSPTQQALERGWLFFSPRYTRASLALVADAFQGGLRGRESRKMFAGMIAGGTATYAGIATALGQEVKLDPRSKQDGGNGAEFMTIEINGRNVGIGSFWTSFIRLIASTGAQAIEDPRTLMAPNTRDNPIARWLRSRSAPMSGMALDLYNGTTFMGEPLDNAGAWGTHISKQSMPFVVENAIFDDGAIFGRLTTAMPAELAGMRTFGVSLYEQRNTERDLAAAERFNKQWDELNGLQKDSLENDPNRPLGRLSEQVKKESNKMRPSDPESAEGVLDTYFRDKEEIELDWREVIKAGVALFDDQRIDAVTLKERYIEPANAKRRLRIGDLSEDESFQEVSNYFSSMSDDEKAVIPEEYAFSEYIEQIVSADFSDPIVGFNFRARDAAERLYGDQFGQEMLAYVRERFRSVRESYDFEMPSMLDELYIGRERFQWYWRDVEAEVMKQQQNPEILMGKYEKWLGETPTRRTALKETNRDLKSFLSTMSKTRRLLREKNPELDAFLYRWGFADTLAHQDNQFDGALDFWRHAPGMAFPLPTMKFE